MITSGTFGRGGRLGNQIFQAGLLYAVSMRHGHGFFLPRANEQLWECFDLDIPSTGPGAEHEFHERLGTCNFDPMVFEQPDGTAFHGYYQSHRYYEGCRSEYAAFLRFKAEHREFAEGKMDDYRRRYGLPVVSVHYRRGDYLDPVSEAQWGNLHKDGYYEKVTSRIGEKVLYLVFSDDLRWCRNHVDFEIVELAPFDACKSLCLMTLCDVNVVANSAFSWWGAFLNQGSSTVYAPSRWYGQAMPWPNNRQDDILPPEWVRIPTFA